jgi:hypothetical protein
MYLFDILSIIPTEEIETKGIAFIRNQFSEYENGLEDKFDYFWNKGLR